MDNLTHTLIGIGLAKAGLSQRFGRGVTTILVIASNLPDIDVAFLAGGPLAFLWRRTPTHSLVGTVLLGLLAGMVFRHFYPELGRMVLGLTAVGIGAHVLADLWNSYGVVLFWPFNWRRVDFSWVFIIDLVIWGILGVSWIVGFAARSHTVWIWRIGLGLLTLYIGVCASARYQSAALLKDRMNREGIQIKQMFLYPEPFGPRFFRGVVNEGERYSVYQIAPFKRKVERMDQLDIEEKSPAVTAARRTPAGQKLDWFFGTPVWRPAPDGNSALVYGLGFRTRLLKDRNPFVFRVDPSGSVKKI